MKTILFATDFAPAGEKALNWARLLSQRYGATLHMVHVHSPNVAVPIVPGIGAAVALDTIPFDDDRLIREQLADLAHQLEQEGVEVQTHYRVGHVDDEVSAVAADIQADLIVTGRQPMDTFLDRLLGTTATDVAKGASCPVLVVPDTATKQPVRLQHIAYASQLQGNDMATLRTALQLASTFGAMLTLIRVEAENQPNLYNDKQTLRELQEEFGKDAFSVHKVAARTVSSGLGDYLARHPTDLLIMITHARGFLDGLLSPSLTGRMLTQTEIPVLVYQG